MKKEATKKQISMTVDLPLYERIKKEAEANNVSVSDQIRFYLTGVAAPGKWQLKA